MLIKEYRIPLPLTVEEYRVAQLYMIAKKSREESIGAGSGVEIIVNEPYVDGPGGQGQYTRKIYHIGSRLPGWLKAVLPKSAQTAEEEAWNAYPYTKTRYTYPFVDKFFMEIETKYFGDAGTQDNVFQLSPSELRGRIVDLIDVVKDQLWGGDYNREEDPKYFSSQRTGRGPLADNWLETAEDGPAIMCAYKLCRVEVKYWGIQGKVEKFIHDVALRRTMLSAHRQAWAWQDEWIGMTMDDIRQLEKETQEALTKTMAREEDQEGEVREKGPHETAMRNSSSGLSVQEVDLTSIDKDKDFEINQDVRSSALSKSRSPSPLRTDMCKPQNLQLITVAAGSNLLGDVNRVKENMPGDGRRKLWSRSNSKTALHSPSGSSTKSFEIQIANWRMESICQQSDTSSEEEFFDAEDESSPTLMAKWSSLEMMNSADQGTPESVEHTEDEENLFSEHFAERLAMSAASRLSSVGPMDSMEGSFPDSPTSSSPTHHHRHHSNSFPSHHPGYSHHHMISGCCCPTSVLILVVHAGSVLDEGAEMATSKKSDLTTFRGAFESVLRQHYPSLQGRIAIRLVTAPRICSEALNLLSSLSPYSFQASPSAIDGLYRNHDAVPLGALPLFAISSPDYQEHVNRVIASANQSYHEFLRCEDGLGFAGQVVLMSDSIGSLLAYDALCRTAQYSSRYGSENSIPEMDAIPPSGLHHQTTCPIPPPSPCIRSNPLISISDGSGTEEGSEEGNETITRARPPSRIYKKSISQPQESTDGPFSDAVSYSRLLSAPPSRRRSSCSSDLTGPQKLDFDVSDFFTFGSPLGTILAYRKMLFFEDKKDPPPRPQCGQMYNLFHPSDPSASRMEPLLHSRFSHLPPVTVPRYHKYPLGDGQPIHLMEYIHVHAHVFVEGASLPPAICTMGRRTSEASITSNMSGIAESVPLGIVSAITQKWWGTKRLDYALYCPEGLSSFPANSLPHLFHASYWESSDVVAFVLRQMVRSDNLLLSGDSDKETPVFIPTQPREKWLRKRTSVKIKLFPFATLWSAKNKFLALPYQNVAANHRANDVIAKDGSPQVMAARFMYGPLDMVALSGEKVDVHVMRDQRSGEWSLLSTEVTDKSGRLTYTIPKEKALGFGMFPMKIVVRGDHTCIDFFMAVVPPKTECVVFSIDGSFTASVSVTGKDPKVRAGAVDVVRHWQELGYLIIYVTGRPDMQQQRVVAWLAQHNFPHGLVTFAEGFSTDPLKHKADYLKHLQMEVEMIIYAAYGSSKDIWVYTAIGIPAERIFTVGKASKKQHGLATVLSEGYASHLSDLKSLGRCRPAQGNARMVIPRSCFSLPGQVGAGALRQRRSAKRTTSYPLASGQQQALQDKGRGFSPKPAPPSKATT